MTSVHFIQKTGSLEYSTHYTGLATSYLCCFLVGYIFKQKVNCKVGPNNGMNADRAKDARMVMPGVRRRESRTMSDQERRDGRRPVRVTVEEPLAVEVRQSRTMREAV